MRIEKYIQKRCKEDGIEFDINKLNKLNEIIDRYDPQIKEYIDDVHLVFTIWNKDFHHPNGNSTFRHSIWLNGEWAYILTHNDCGYTQEKLFGFVEDTIGHELGHKMKGRSMESLKYAPTLSSYYFISKLHEIFCDFYAHNFINSDNSKQIILSACDFKLKHKNNIDKTNKIHPNWETRKRYIDNYAAFSEKLIRDYAKECGIRNQKFIDSIVEHYREFFPEDTDGKVA